MLYAPIRICLSVADDVLIQIVAVSDENIGEKLAVIIARLYWIERLSRSVTS